MKQRLLWITTLSMLLLGPRAQADDPPAGQPPETTEPATPTPGPSAVVTLIDGSVLSVHDVSLSADRMIHARSEVGEFHWKWAEILSLTLATTERPVSRFPGLLLVGGEVIHGEVVSSNEESIEIKNEIVGRMVVPLTAVEGILLADRLAPRARARAMERLRRVPRTSDLFLLANGDVLSGTVSQFGPAEWTLEVAGQPRTVETDRLLGVSLDPRLIDYPRPPGPWLMVRWIDGSRVLARELVTSGAQAELTPAFGLPVSLTWGNGSLPALSEIEVQGGRVTFLSDLIPSRMTSQPFFDAPVLWKSNANAQGDTMTIGTQSFERGIGMQSRSRLDFEAVGHDRFLATIGVDGGADDEAGVIFRVLLDGQLAYESPVLTLVSESVLVDLPLGGAGQLSLEVDFGPRGDAGDLANWANARLLRPASP